MSVTIWTATFQVCRPAQTVHCAPSRMVPTRFGHSLPNMHMRAYNCQSGIAHLKCLPARHLAYPVLIQNDHYPPVRLNRRSIELSARLSGWTTPGLALWISCTWSVVALRNTPSAACVAGTD